MKCKRCGAELRETDRICLNCGALVSNSTKDLYDDINVDEDEDTSYLDEDDNNYNKELEDLLNSYKKETKTDNNVPDYSVFSDLNDNKDIKDIKFTDTSQENNSISTGANKNNDEELDDFSVDNLVSFSNEKKDFSDYNEYSSFDTNKNKFKFSLDFGDKSFKIIFVIALIVLVSILGLFGYKYYQGHKGYEEEYEINKEKENITSKYSLKTNPNYIAGKTWVCGNPDANGELGTDVNSFFQYDFDNKKRYEMQFLHKEESYENGTYNVSLEDISNDQYTYKLTITANLDGGYKTRYTFTLITNKEGTKATYKLNSSVSSCEEMEYFNSKQE